MRKTKKSNPNPPVSSLEVGILAFALQMSLRAIRHEDMQQSRKGADTGKPGRQAGGQTIKKIFSLCLQWSIHNMVGFVSSKVIVHRVCSL